MCTIFIAASSNGKYLALDSSPLSSEEVKESDQLCSSMDNHKLSEPSEPITTNMVLRKRIHRIKQGMRRYNKQVSILRADLRKCKRKTAEQEKQIAEQQKQLAEQQKQTMEYATRLDEYDKKNEEISRKFSTLLQELNKCKTELQYWRSKSPATPPFCTGCGVIVASPAEELEALVNQGVIPEGLNLEPIQEREVFPLAGTSNDNQISDDKNEKEVDILMPLSPLNLKTTKRKAVDTKETPLSSSSPKKLRYGGKIRTKRVKV